jgi:hypothetical protein
MNVQEATELLSTCVRSELRDHAFGDSEIYWSLLGEPIAEGYFGSGSASVSVFTSSTEASTLPDGEETFEGDEAHQLRRCGVEGEIERNDETGPDEYDEGTTMPGLTLEGVRQELTGWGVIEGRIKLDGTDALDDAKRGVNRYRNNDIDRSDMTSLPLDEV